jgi:hypothetical protein
VSVNNLAGHDHNELKHIVKYCIKFICKEGYQSRINLMKDENGDLLAVSHNALNMRKNYFSQLLNVHSVSDVRQREIHMTEPLVLDPSPFEVEIAITKLKNYKMPGSDQIQAELIQAGGETLLSAIHKLINSIWNKEQLSDQWKESVVVPIYKKGDKSIVIIMEYHFYQLHVKLYPIFSSQG